MPALRFILSGAFAGALLGLFEFVYLFTTVGDSFDGGGELATAAFYLIALLGGVGAFAGLAVSLGEQLLRRAPARYRIFGAALLGLPLIAIFCSQIFSGARARLVVGRQLYATFIGALLFLALFAGLRLLRDLETAKWPRRMAAILVLCLSAIALYLADQRVLPRLYFFFHVGLGVTAFATLQSAIWLSGVALRKKWVLLLPLLGPVGLYGFHRHRPLRAVTVERTQLAAPLVRAALPARRTAMGDIGSKTTRLEERQPSSLGARVEGADLFLITVDALRADRLTARVMPRLSALAEHGVVFDEAYTQVPHTSFSVATLLTGKYVYSLSALGLDAASHQTLPEVLRRERYKTAAFFPPAVFYIDHDRLRALESSSYGFEYVKYEYLPAPERTDQVIDFLEREHPAHAFVWVHYFEPHEPYELHAGHLLPGAGMPPSDAERYDGEAHFVDQEIARLIDYLQRTRPHAVVVLTADHGEEFGEHGGRYHGTTLYDEQVRVPLVFLSLDGRLLPRRIRGPVGLIDLAPTLLSLISVVPSARMRGHDLTPHMAEGSPAEGPVFGEINRHKMVVTDKEKLLCDLESDACQLFDRAQDPNERHPLHDEARLSALRGRLDEWMAEELRFEAPSADEIAKGTARATKEERQAIERGRLGDRGAVPALAELLRRQPGAGGALAKEAAALLCRLPPEPETAAALRGALASADSELSRFARIGLARLGDQRATSDLRRELPTLCGGGQAELCARAALATSDVPALEAALDQVADDQSLELALIGALGRSRDPRARDPLLIALGRVRTRKETVEALTVLGDPTVLPFIERWIAWDPYIPVRVAMAHLLGVLGKSEPHAVLATLRALAKVERDPPVMAAVVESLVQLGASEVHDLSKGDALPADKGEVWLVGSGEGAVAIDGESTTATMQGGVARIVLAHRARLRLRPAEGAVLKWAYLRNQPSESRSQAR